MTKSADKVTAGLVFLSPRNFDIVRIGNRVCAVLDRLDEQIAGFRVLSDMSVTLRTASYALHIEIESDRYVPTLDQPAANFIALTLVRAEADPEMPSDAECDQSLAVLAHALQALHATLAPDYVQWIEPMAILSSADFRMATTISEDELVVEPRIETRAAPRQSVPEPEQPRRENLPDIEETNNVLLARLIEKDGQGGAHGTEGTLRAVFRDANPDTPDTGRRKIVVPDQSALLRLSVWLFTITLGLFALPVAAALMVFNLLRGENLRLTAQTAALTGTFISLQATGSTAQAMSMVQTLLG